MFHGSIDGGSLPPNEPSLPIYSTLNNIFTVSLANSLSHLQLGNSFSQRVDSSFGHSRLADLQKPEALQSGQRLQAGIGDSRLRQVERDEPMRPSQVCETSVGDCRLGDIETGKLGDELAQVSQAGVGERGSTDAEDTDRGHLSKGDQARIRNPCAVQEDSFQVRPTSKGSQPIIGQPRVARLEYCKTRERAGICECGDSGIVEGRIGKVQPSKLRNWCFAKSG
ncbi:hypothetical protein Sinac_6129 [Singulisphaera acidiphila DSM 18658]|uniref:Uncharacterized protein n=1 Tax=Singulisphaera acidiphila (strain ATCC BAA-1392 / DSM 18658 / VKM B-2454 / MOB10) TaxID=886293 RepID=L0DLV4_SINAD|nr:hypothetical protein Sinac_6129 [Singulisphaera acidiphila DSM 18658]